MMGLWNQKYKIRSLKLYKLQQKPSHSESLEASAEENLNNIFLKLDLSIYGTISRSKWLKSPFLAYLVPG